ncbi:hypothetical protein ACXPWS_09280 [Mycobacterium sp. BMJ-28]
MDEIRGSLKHLPINSTWSGQAAEAANDSLDKLGTYLANNAAAHHESSIVIGQVASEIEGVQQLLRHVLDFAEGKFSINLDTGAVKPLTDDVSASDQEYVTTTLKQILAAAEVIDRELAHGLNLLDGTDQPGSPPTIPIDQDSERARNQKDAFKRVYGYEPMTANDWRMAAALDPHSYLPKNNGVPPQIVAGRITPQPGKGVVRTNLFIPTDQVINTWKDMTDLQNQRLFPMNFGDNRGPSATADPEDSRVSLYVDYDNGIVVARQNPTAAVDGQRGGAAAGTPNIHVVQAPDGRMTIDYDASDAYENPAGTAMGVTVNGRVTLSPQDDGVVALGGNTTIYPSMETYQYRAGVPPETLQWTPANSGSEYGPGTSLTRHHWVGDATIPAVRPDMPGWKWELENANPFGDDPFLSHTTQLTDPFQGSIPTVGTGR